MFSTWSGFSGSSGTYRAMFLPVGAVTEEHTFLAPSGTGTLTYVRSL